MKGPPRKTHASELAALRIIARAARDYLKESTADVRKVGIFEAIDATNKAADKLREALRLIE